MTSKEKMYNDKRIAKMRSIIFLTEVLVKKALEPEESKFVFISDVKNALMEYFDDEPKWLNNKWVGRAIRRLGFKEGRRLGTHREIKLERKEVFDKVFEDDKNE